VAVFTKLVVALVLGLVVSAGAHDGASSPARDRLPSEARRTFAERPSGEWVATGHVLTANHVVGRAVGAVLKRRWRFQTTCPGGHCRTYFFRTSSTGVQRSLVRFHRGVYNAEFDWIPSDCELRPGVFDSFGVNFSIWWTKNRSHLVAEEMGGFVDDPRCGTAGERIRWTARRRYGSASEGAPQVF
jgi:hypothetical protein